MYAVVKTKPGPGHVEYIDMPEPQMKENQVLLEIENCGICGTDLHVYHDTFKNYPPVILGHEFYGRVVDRGRNIDGIKLNDSFAVLGAVARVCGECTFCHQGEFMYCKIRRGMGHGVHGAFTKLAVARKDQLYRIPDGLHREEAALVEPLAAAVHAVCEVGSPNLGDNALVSGPGPIGLLVVKLLVSQGIKVFVAGTNADDYRLLKALEYGAAEAINVEEADIQQAIMDWTDGKGTDMAFEVAGAAESVNNCLNSLRPLGTYIQVGHFGKKIVMDWDHAAFKQLTIKGSLGYTRNTWSRTMKILEQGRIGAAEVITHRLPLSQWKTGFDLMQSKSAVKVMLHYDN